MITHLQHFALGVPDLAPGANFYETFGLEAVNRPDHLAFRCQGRAQDQVVLIETGRDRKFHHISFGADAAGLVAIRARLEARGIAQLDPPYAGAPAGLWLQDPDGHLVNVQQADAAMRESEDPPVRNSPGRVPRSGLRGCPPHDHPGRPRRLGHIILFTTDTMRKAAFYRDVLGMRISDTIVDAYAAFLRTGNDSDHHVLAFLKSSAPGFHHASFEVGTIDEAELGAMRLLGKGYKHAWGPGRHGVGSNYFHYFRDPWKGMCEYFHDMDSIPGELDWEPQDWTKKDGMFLWSADGPPPADFGHNYEAG